MEESENMHQQKLLLLYRLIYEDHNRSIVFCSFSSSLEYKNQNVSDYMPLSTTKIIVIAGTTSRKKKIYSTFYNFMHDSIYGVHIPLFKILNSPPPHFIFSNLPVESRSLWK